jgi:tetratricopeptide (TPR) repeat protein
MRALAILLTLACVAPGLALAQVDLVDPDAPAPRPSPRAPPPPPEEVDDTPAPDSLLVPVAKPKPAVAPSRAPAAVPKVEPKKEPPPRPEPPALVVRTISDADLDAAWARWRDANASKNPGAELAARKALLELKSLTGTRNAEYWAVGLLRAAAAWEAAGDSGAAVEIALTASELAPDLPATWFLLSRLYFTSDPAGVGRYLTALGRGIAAQLSDPRYLRPMLADVGAVVIVSFIGTAIVVVVVLLLRRGLSFLYDFHFFFPRAAAHWQTTAIAVLLLLLPVVLRLGVVPVLLVLFAAVTLYLTMLERLVAVALIGALGFVPLAAAALVEATAFADTTAEDLYTIERGGPGSEALVRRYEKLAAEDKVGFAERFVLGHFFLNRGRLDDAVKHLKGALAIRPEDLPGRVALAKAFFLQGDLENSRGILEALKQVAPNAVVLHNLGRVYQRRVQVHGETSAIEVDKANENLAAARALDPSLRRVADDEPAGKEIIGNDLLRTLPLSRADLLEQAKAGDAGKRVRSQLASILSGDVLAGPAVVYPLLAAGLVLAFGLLAGPLDAARVCARCGRCFSKRGDPDVSPGSQLCTQCVNVFARKNVVAPSVKVRKQLEVARYESRVQRATNILGFVWSGMGHVFAGLPVQGAVYGFVFVLAVTAAVFRYGVLRAPFEGVPVALRLIPVALVFVAVYVLSIRQLRRR